MSGKISTHTRQRSRRRTKYAVKARSLQKEEEGRRDHRGPKSDRHFPARCEVCQEKQAKYRCPGCLAHTCDLTCVARHKETAQCSGKRNKTAYISIKDFTTLDLTNDLHFLEDAARQAEVAAQDGRKFADMLPPKLRYLMNAAEDRGIHLKLMPRGMSRHEKNASFFHFQSRAIRWTVEWEFPAEKLHFMDKEFVDTGLVQSGVDRHIQQHLRQQENPKGDDSSPSSSASDVGASSKNDEGVSQPPSASADNRTVSKPGSSIPTEADGASKPGESTTPSSPIPTEAGGASKPGESTTPSSPIPTEASGVSKPGESTTPSSPIPTEASGVSTKPEITSPPSPALAGVSMVSMESTSPSKSASSASSKSAVSSEGEGGRLAAPTGPGGCDGPLSLYTEGGGRRYRVFLKAVSVRAAKERYYELDKGKNLCANLQGKHLLEFPSLIVVPEDDAKSYTLLSEAEKREIGAWFAQMVQSQGSYGHGRKGRYVRDRRRSLPRYQDADTYNPQSKIFKP